MATTRKFALVFLAGVGLLALGFTVVSTEYQEIAQQFLTNPNAYVPGCNPGSDAGCVIWPYVVLGLVVAGLICVMVGAMGYFEARFPRENL